MKKVKPVTTTKLTATEPPRSLDTWWKTIRLKYTAIYEAIRDRSLEDASLSEEAFEKKFMRSRPVVQDYTAFAERMERPGVRARVLLTAYLIAFYGFCEDLRPAARAWLSVLHEMPMDDVATATADDNILEEVYEAYEMRRPQTALERLTEAASEFCASFHAWQEADRINTIAELCALYWNTEAIYLEAVAIEEDLESERHRGLVAERNHIHKRCIETMQIIDKCKSFYSLVPVDFKNVPYSPTDESLIRAFWSVVKEDVQVKPVARLERLLTVFELLDEAIQVIVLRPETSPHYEQFKDLFDTDYIRQRHVHNALDGAFWYQRCYAILELLKKLDSESHDEEHTEAWLTFQEAVQTGAPEEAFGHCIDLLEYAVRQFFRLRYECIQLREIIRKTLEEQASAEASEE